MTISTVWLGINHNWSGVGDPIIFETMIFDNDISGPSDLRCERWSNEHQALAGHAAIVDDWMQMSRAIEDITNPVVIQLDER